MNSAEEVDIVYARENVFHVVDGVIDRRLVCAHNDATQVGVDNMRSESFELIDKLQSHK